MSALVEPKKFKLRRFTEPVVYALLVAASVVAILTTVGIVLSVAAESLRFFHQVPLASFLFGTDW